MLNEGCDGTSDKLAVLFITRRKLHDNRRMQIFTTLTIHISPSIQYWEKNQSEKMSHTGEGRRNIT